MPNKPRPTTDQVEKKLHDAEVNGHIASEAAATASGAAVGALVGALAGPPGAVVGAVVGGLIGAVSGVGFERGLREKENADHEVEEIEAEADRVIESRRPTTRPPPDFPEAPAAAVAK